MTQNTVTSARLIIRHGDKIVWVQDANTGGWMLPGGKIDGKEHILDAVCRKACERLGINIPHSHPIKIVHAGADVNSENDQLLVTIYYSVTLPTEQEITNMEFDMHSAVKWQPYDALPGRLAMASARDAISIDFSKEIDIIQGD
jgi:ADP-ribose pyrophosphatase YjhB (NUDIX family)